jgi:hypothetical protein
MAQSAIERRWSIFTVGVYKSANVRVAFPSRKATLRGTRLNGTTVKMIESAQGSA